MLDTTTHPFTASSRHRRRALVAASVVAATWSFAGAASAQEPAPPPALTATISVSPSSVTPPATATATATFEVGEIANVVGGRVVTLSLNIVGSDGSLRLDEASITTSAGLTCAPAGAAPVLSYNCEVAGPKSTTDTYSISATILSQTPDSGFPVVAEVSANASFRDGTNASIDGMTDRTNLAVLLPGVDPPPGTTISAACVDDQVTVDITANTNFANFFINVGEEVDLLAPAVAPGSYPFPAGGASEIRARVFTLPDLNLIFDETVPCTVTPTTTAPTTVAPTTVAPTTVAPTTMAPTTVGPTTTNAGGAAPELPATGRGTGGLALVALALIGLGGLALTATRRGGRQPS